MQKLRKFLENFYFFTAVVFLTLHSEKSIEKENYKINAY